MKYQYQFSHKIGLQWVIKHMPQFLFPDLSKKKDRIMKPFSGVIVTLDKKPVGLILSTFDNLEESVRIHSLFVHPNFRNQGIGTQLVNQLEKDVKTLGAQKIDGYFRSHWKFVKAIRSILHNQDWSIPKEDLIIVKGEAKKVLKLFMDNRVVLPEGYSFVTIDMLPESVRSEIKRRGKENWYLSYLNPFVNESSIFPAASIFLKHQDKVIGWVISHLIAPNLNEFTALFVDQDHRPYKLAHLLMRKAIYEQKNHGIKNFLITSKTDNYVMSRFLLRHAPTTEVFLTQSLHSYKTLSGHELEEE